MACNPRKLAADVLTEVLQGGAYNNIALREALLKHQEEMTTTDKAFVTDLVNGTLRNLIHIDYVIASFATGRIKPFVKNVLRVSVYQLIYTGHPSYAILNEATEIIKKSKFKQTQGFVNGILRNIERNKETINYPTDPLEALSVKYSFPMPLLTYFSGFISLSDLETFLKSALTPPTVTICTNTLKISREDLIKQLESEGVVAQKSEFNDKAIYLKKTNDIQNLTAFKSGLFHVMDEVSMEAARILAPTENSVVYDLCAAPGGKTFYMAQLMKGTGKIVACDIHAHKIKLIDESAKRLGITNITATLNDASMSGTLEADTADFVLLDAPCSGFGIIRKKPDIKYTKTVADIKKLAELQKKLLKFSAKYAKIGQYLLYSTCTISVEENEKNIEWFTSQFDYEKITEKQYLNSHTDGFYIALLRRRS